MFTPFNKPYLTGKELEYITKAHANGQLAGDGHFTKLCSEWLENHTGCAKALLTHSCTAALEMAAILADIKPGDEVIMPSYTFVSTANAFVLRGAVPVFVDIRIDTLNIDDGLIEQAITIRTKAIVVVHYAGVACEMNHITEIARKHGLLVIEDAAQALMSTYRGRALGSIGDIGCISFHETKNVISGEGGAILINNPKLIERAEVIREKGTNRSKFFRGQVDKYTWVDIGSSYLPGEITAAFLWAQLNEAKSITNKRLEIWNAYHIAFTDLANTGRFKQPLVDNRCEHNGHMYYLLMRSLDDRTNFIARMRSHDVACVFHYIPLHSASFGIKTSRCSGEMHLTDQTSDTIVRLPLWIGVDVETVVDSALASARAT
jgi:dTDP-4-amino-4,6-dideoxygalactose transaminase